MHLMCKIMLNHTINSYLVYGLPTTVSNCAHTITEQYLFTVLLTFKKYMGFLLFMADLIPVGERLFIVT